MKKLYPKFSKNILPGLIVLILAFFSSLPAEKLPQHSFNYYSIEQGMASNNIWDYYEDESGRLLVATSNGLNIIGNNEIVVLNRDDGLPANVVLSLTPWPGKGVLLGTINGYCLFKDNRIFPIADSPHEIFRDFEVLKDSSVIAVASRKIYFLDPSAKVRDSLVFKDAAQTFRDAYPISQHSFYLASTDGLFFFNYGKVDTIATFWQKAVWQIVKLENLLFFVSNRGVWSTLDGKIFRRMFTPPGDHQRSINDIIKIDDRRYWLGTWGDGILEYDGFKFSRKIGYTEGFPSLYVTRFYKDKSGGIFIGSYGSGAIYKRHISQSRWLKHDYPQISENMIGASEVDNNLVFWGSDDFIGKIEGEDIKFIPLPKNIKKNPNGITFFKGNYFLATADALYKGKSLNRMSKILGPLPSTAIRFLQSSSEDLWLLTTTNIIKISPGYQEYKFPQGTYYSTSNKYFISKFGNDYYLCGEHLPLMKLSKTGISLLSKTFDNMYNGMAIIDDSSLVLGENGGIVHLHHDETIAESHLPAQKTLFLTSDNRGGYWTGFQNGDIYHIHDVDTLKISGKDIPIIGQSRDAFVINDYLFVITRTGIFQYNLFSNNYRFFHINDILGGETPGEIDKAVLLFDSIMLLTNAGIIQFREPFIEGEYASNIELFRMEIPTQGKFVNFPGEKTNIEIEDRNLINFKLLGLNYTLGSNSFSSVRLLPVEQNFKKFYNRFDFQYTQLQPGVYSFQYFSENFFGKKSDIQAYTFTVTSSSIFVPKNILLVLLIIVLLVTAIYYVIRNILKFRRKVLADKIIERTELLKERVSQLQREKSKRSEFYRIFSHDLKAPVRNILGLSRIIDKKNSTENKEIENYVERIRDNATKTMDMIEDILELTGTEGSSYAFEEIELQPFFQNLLTQFRADINQFNIQIEYDLNLKRVVAERKKLRIIFQNLIDNAIKYHAEDRAPVISIRSKKTAEFYQIAISDNGMGIPGSQLENIFSIYQRGNNALSTGVSGRGVGLTAAKRLVDGYLGKLEVASEMGQGSTFIVSLSRNFLENNQTKIKKK